MFNIRVAAVYQFVYHEWRYFELGGVRDNFGQK